MPPVITGHLGIPAWTCSIVPRLGTSFGTTVCVMILLLSRHTAGDHIGIIFPIEYLAAREFVLLYELSDHHLRNNRLLLRTTIAWILPLQHDDFADFATADAVRVVYHRAKVRHTAVGWLLVTHSILRLLDSVIGSLFKDGIVLPYLHCILFLIEELGDVTFRLKGCDTHRPPFCYSSMLPGAGSANNESISDSNCIGLSLSTRKLMYLPRPTLASSCMNPSAFSSSGPMYITSIIHV